jgi:hypothetical protein
MANFTYLICGAAYDPTGSAALAVSLNGSQIYHGSVTSIDQPIVRNTELQELCRWNTDTALVGTVNLQINSDAAQIFFAGLAQEITYGNVDNVLKMTMELEYADPAIDDHAVTNVRIAGVNQPTPVNPDPDKLGDIRAWHYRFDGAQFECDYFTGPYTDR